MIEEKINQSTTNHGLSITLLIIGLVASISGMLSGLLLIDIGETFNVNIGYAGQINTFSSIVSIFFALLTSVFSVKYNHKSLLQIGLLVYIVSAAGCYLAPSFGAMMASYSLTGIGFALTTTMALTLPAEHYPIDKRSTAIGMVFAGMSVSYIIGSMVVPFLQGLGGWRASFLYYMLPCSMLAFILATITIPRGTGSSHGSIQTNFIEGYKKIFSNRSALFSLVGNLLAMATWQGILTYNTSFFRDWFRVSIGEASIFILIGSSLYTVGSMISGRMVNRLGRKPLAAASIMAASLFFMVFSYLPNFFFSAAVVCLGWFLLGVRDTSATSLIIEQLPLYTGIMMSLNRAVTQVGFSVGSGFGGALLLFLNYQFMFVGLGLLGILSAIVFQWLTIDPSMSR